VSHEGVRLELTAGQKLPQSFMLRVPMFNVAVRVQRVWSGPAPGRSAQLWCGGSLAGNPQHNTLPWLQLVDKSPSLDMRVKRSAGFR
jgi:hypothetical protein